MTLIGLGYKAKAGKDTIADYLVRRHGFVKLGFADALKLGAKAIYGLTDEQVYGDQKEALNEQWGVTNRALLQIIGQALRVGHREDVWITALKARLDSLWQGECDCMYPGHKSWCASFSSPTRFVITGVRHVNEAEAIKSWGGRLVHVFRPGVEPAKGVAGHVSETALDDYAGWDERIVNDSTLDVLYLKVDRQLLGL